MTDTDIAAAVRRALAWNSIVPTDCVRASVSNGIVTLEGRVPYTSQRLDGARVIANLAGVRGVINKIEVIEPHVAPHAVRAAISDALVQHAKRELRDLQIDIVDGRVTLTGNVQSEGERRAIIGAVTGTRGVEEVISQLHVVG
jgi:osmotically-inducible protein OsmY